MESPRLYRSSDKVVPSFVGDYQIGKQVGRGRNGIVFKAVNVKTGEFVAIKQIKTSGLDSKALDSVKREIEILRKLRHPNIVRVIGEIVSEGHFHLLLEFCDSGSLTTIIEKFGPFPETLVARYGDQILAGLQYLHQNNILHRDIKGGNILLTRSGTVKLAVAPEVVEMTGQCAASDIWSVGATIIELITSEPPYFKMPPVSAMFRIVQDPHPPLPEDISPELRDFLLLCFAKSINERPTAQRLRSHAWLVGLRRNQSEGEDKEDASMSRSEQKDTNVIDELKETVRSYNRSRTSRILSPSDAVKLKAASDEAAGGHLKEPALSSALEDGTSTLSSDESRARSKLMNPFFVFTDSTWVEDPGEGGPVQPDEGSPALPPDLAGGKAGGADKAGKRRVVRRRRRKDGLDGSVSRDSLLEEIKQLKASLAAELSRREEVELEVESLSREVEALRQSIRERNSPERTSKDYFCLIGMAVKMNVLAQGKECNANISALYSRAQKEGISWQSWIYWVPAQLGVGVDVTGASRASTTSAPQQQQQPGAKLTGGAAATVASTSSGDESQQKAVERREIGLPSSGSSSRLMSLFNRPRMNMYPLTTVRHHLQNACTYF